MKINLWNTMELVKVMDNIVNTLSPKNDIPELYLTACENGEGVFEYKVHTLFGWLKLKATSTGQVAITRGAKVTAQIDLGGHAFITFDSNGEFEWNYNFKCDGFTLEFQKSIKAEIEKFMVEE